MIGENAFTELKKQFNDSVIESLVAFSNFKGGKVIVGIDETTKSVVGVKLSKETIQNWQNEIKTKTEPFITPDIYVENMDGKQIVVFETISFPFKPVSFKSKYFIRKNNSNHKMSTSEVAELFLRVKNSSWDFYPKENFTKKDLDESKIINVINLIEKNRG
jgi:ATP-dependent DNA helicase RecG